MTKIDIDKLGAPPFLLADHALIPAVKENGDIVIPIPEELRESLYWDDEEIYSEDHFPFSDTNQPLKVVTSFECGKGRWESHTMVVVELYGRYWGLMHLLGLTEGQEHRRFSLCTEMVPLWPEQVTVTVYKNMKLREWS